MNYQNNYQNKRKLDFDNTKNKKIKVFDIIKNKIDNQEIEKIDYELIENIRQNDDIFNILPNVEDFEILKQNTQINQYNINFSCIFENNSFTLDSELISDFNKIDQYNYAYCNTTQQIKIMPRHEKKYKTEPISIKFCSKNNICNALLNIKSDDSNIYIRICSSLHSFIQTYKLPYDEYYIQTNI